MRFYIALLFITLFHSCPCVPKNFQHHHVFHAKHASNGNTEYNEDWNTEVPYSEGKQNSGENEYSNDDFHFTGINKEYDNSIVYPVDRPRFYEDNRSMKSDDSSYREKLYSPDRETAILHEGAMTEFNCIQKEGRFICQLPVKFIDETITRVFKELCKVEKGDIEGSGLSIGEGSGTYDLLYDDEDLNF